jgi:hypothetical protein
MKTRLRKNITKVKVYSADQKTFIGIGKYVGAEKIQVWGWKAWTPKFKVGRNVYRGCECWWITLSEAKKIENKINKI